MKIGFTDACKDLHPFFINLALFLKSKNIEVIFIEPKGELLTLVKNNNLKILENKKTDCKIEKNVQKEIIQKSKYLSESSYLNKDHYYKKFINSYKTYFEPIKNQDFDVILSWNDVWGISTNIAKKLNIPVVFFENGYFPGTIQINNKGVNKDTDYAFLSYEKFMKFKLINNNNKKNSFKVVNVNLNKFQSLLSRIRESVSSNNNVADFLDNFLILIKNKCIDLRKRFIREDKIKIPDKVIFIPFQVKNDTQILNNSPIIKKMDDILDFFYKDIREVLPKYFIVVKEHPQNLERENYSKLKKKYPSIIWLKKYDLEKVLNKSEYVLTVNSSVGLQALEKHKKVLILGDCFYKNNPFVESINNKKEFKERLQKLKNKKYNKREIDRYINHFKDNIFIKGGWKNFDENTLEKIYHFILKTNNPKGNII